MDALKPSPALLAKVGSIVGHAAEFFGPDGHRFDKAALDALLSDPDVQEWMRQMRMLQLVPEPRSES